MYLIFPLFKSKITTILAQNRLDQNHEMTVSADFGAKTQIFWIFYTKKAQLLHENNIANISSFLNEKPNPDTLCWGEEAAGSRCCVPLLLSSVVQVFIAEQDAAHTMQQRNCVKR